MRRPEGRSEASDRVSYGPGGAGHAGRRAVCRRERAPPGVRPVRLAGCFRSRPPARSLSGQLPCVRGPMRERPPLSAPGQRTARIRSCDGCHLMKLHAHGPYTRPTRPQFNMCNCTALRGVPAAVSSPSPETRRAAHRHAARARRRAQKRSRWTRRSPARSTTYPCHSPDSSGRPGRGTCWGRSRVMWSQRCPGRLGRLGDPAVSSGSAKAQASLRCCGMPASRARTSASR